MFALIYSNEDDSVKRFTLKRYHLPNRIIENYQDTINRENFYHQPLDSDIKRHKEIRELITGKGKGFTTGYMLDYEHIKNHYNLKADTGVDKVCLL